MYCMQVDTRYDEQIKESIKRFVLVDGEEAFMPMTERLKKYKHVGWTTILKPSCPGYVFIRSEDGLDLYFRLKKSLGETIFKYARILRNNEYIQKLTPEEEKFIMDYCDKEHIIRASYAYKKGDKLIVYEGPFKGREGELVDINRHHATAYIKTEFMGQTMKIPVGLAVIKKIDE